MARKTTIAAFEAWIGLEENVQRVLDLVIEGKTMREASLAVKQPYTCLQGYFRSSEERKKRYVEALESYADYIQGEAKEIADDVVPDKDHVAKAKLRIDVRMVQAKALHRERWGDRLQVDKSVELKADAALLGTVADLLRLAGEKVVAEVPAALEHLDDGQT